MKRTALLMFALTALFGASRWLSADESKDKDKPCCPVAGGGCCGGETCSDPATTAAEAKCPVSGGKISKEVAVDYRGGKVYFCCAGCQGKVKQASAEKQREMVFGDKAFEKAFAVSKPKKEKAEN